MNTLKPTYVTFEQAKWLKEKGFDYMNNSYYSPKGILDFCQTYSYAFKELANKRGKDIIAPEQHHVVEWLRLNHGIWVTAEMIPFEKGRFFEYSICDFDNCLKQNGVYESPQEAYSAAFDYIKQNNLI
jgi:hypothetical protein